MDIRYRTCEEERQNERGTRSIDNNALFAPEDLFIQILLRLPFTSLLRFKCVSKSWFSLISDPYFSTLRYELAASCTQRLMSLKVYGSECISRDLDASLLDDSAAIELNFVPLQPHIYLRIQIIGSCRGFLLLNCNTYLTIWNPSTSVKKRISLPPLLSTTIFVSSYGFGYDPSTDNYLVVVVMVLVRSSARINVATHLELFSLRDDTWTKIEGTHLPYMYLHIGRHVCKASLLNGAIHWLCVHRLTNMVVIFAFELTERSVFKIPLPDDFFGSFLSCDLWVLGGFLGLSVRGNGAANIWVMKEYKVKSSWTKSIDGIPNAYFSPICTAKSGDIIGTDGCTKLVKYNDKGQLLEHRLYCVFPHVYDVAMYTESLLSLPGDNEQAEEDE